MVPKKLNYLGLEWKLHTDICMYDKYKNWSMYVFYPVGNKKKIDIDHINGKFNKLRKDCHIAVEHVAEDPEENNKFHDLAIAVPNNKKFPEKLPEWDKNYSNN